VTFVLAGLGADVIKVETPAGGDISRANAPFVGPGGVRARPADGQDLSLALLNRCRGKRSVTLDLKAPGAADVFAALVRAADVVVENFTAGTADRLGVGYDAARAANPAVVYCSLSGYGADGTPGEPAMDTIIQALSGIMLTGGSPGDPPARVGVPVADALTPLHAVIGILAALQARHRTGEGSHVDVSMLGSLTSLVAAEDWEAWDRLGEPLRTGDTLPRLAPFGLFPCTDGRVAIVAPQDRDAHALFAAMGRPDLVTDDRFATRPARVDHHAEVTALVAAWTGARPVADVVGELTRRRVAVAPVRSPAEAVNDPRVVQRGETLPVLHPDLGEVPGLRTAGVPVRFSNAEVGFARPAPRLGEHTDEVLADLAGMTVDEIAELRAEGVI
jgi:crotonobetainyl-CoA:carnitine CoA-transferase CaiB-like acyl-CoA transferase